MNDETQRGNIVGASLIIMFGIIGMFFMFGCSMGLEMKAHLKEVPNDSLEAPL